MVNSCLSKNWLVKIAKNEIVFLMTLVFCLVKITNYGIYVIILSVIYPVVRYVNFRDERILIAFGKNLKKVRRNSNFTQEELAYQSGVSLSQIARMETGKINPTICTLIAIAKTLKVKAPDLLDF